MELTDILQVAATVILSVGGAGAIIWGLASYFGKLWADKYLDKVKTENKKELEAYKNQLTLIKEGTLRYSNQQFQLYGGLWHALCMLKMRADDLWKEANELNLKNYVKQLEETINAVEFSYLFIEEKHYEHLRDLLTRFGDYSVGKTRLIALYRGEEAPSQEDIRGLIRDNAQIKHEYEELIKEVREQLKKQIRIA